MSRIFKYFLPVFLIFSAFTSNAQIYEPVQWASDFEKVSDSVYELTFEAYIEPNWHLYGLELPEGGPLPTVFNFESSEDQYNLIGDVNAPDPTVEYDEIFEMDLAYYANTAKFSQRIQITDPEIEQIMVSIEYQACDDETCIFEEESITFQIREPSTVDQNSNLNTSEDQEITESTKVEADQGKKDSGKLWGIFAIAFLAGFAALLTPCVFPMIPMTVSFFTKQSESKASGIRNGIFYALSIIGIYVLLSLPFHLFSSVNPSILNEISTNPILNTLFFIVFIIFAISFFGAFEITLPNSWINKADNASNVGGIIGVFFMALTLVLVSFSCTGPLLGALLGGVLTSDGGAMALTIGMLGFGLGLALPFGLFAAFPGWLNSLPKSGGWLNTVKVVLGFLELALAFKFLSNADLVLQLHLLERELFLAIWIAIFGGLVLYLFGKIRLPHDSPLEHLSVGRMLFGLLALSFTIYLIPGLWGAPLQLISGFPPPMQYSESPNGVGDRTPSLISSNSEGMPEGAEYGPNNIISFHDYQKGLEYARSVDKPVMIDFTGHACVNCRKMEERVWSEPQVLDVLKNDIVLISLYVDDKRDLPEDERYVSETTGKKVETIGNKWSDFQVKRYQANAQPYYVLIDHNEDNLIEPIAYEPDAEKYLEWLKAGIANFGD